MGFSQGFVTRWSLMKEEKVSKSSLGITQRTVFPKCEWGNLLPVSVTQLEHWLLMLAFFSHLKSGGNGE